MPINGIIPDQNFLLVRNKIAEIIQSEFDNQKVLDGGNDFYNVGVSAGRTSPIDHTEMPYINVMIGRMNFDNANQGQDDNLVTYFVDVYAKAKASPSKRGDMTASDKLAKYLGITRVILVNPIYRTLGFDPGIIGYRTIRNIDYEDPSRTKDAVVTARARIVYDVKMLETAKAYSEFVEVDETHTTALLGDSAKGYVWVIKTEEPENLIDFDGANLVDFDGTNLIGFTGT